MAETFRRIYNETQHIFVPLKTKNYFYSVCCFIWMSYSRLSVNITELGVLMNNKGTFRQKKKILEGRSGSSDQISLDL